MKTKNNAGPRIERLFALAGIILIIVGCIANAYSAYANLRFIHDPIDVIYYLRYIILLGGGFITGYLLTKKSTLQRRLFMGVVYSILAMVLFYLFDIARVGLAGLFDTLSYPLGKIVFSGMPLLAVFTGLIIGYFTQHRPNRSDVSFFTKFAVLLPFATYQIYLLITTIYFQTTDAGISDPGIPLWITIGSYLISPLAIAAASYLLLGNIKKRLDRIFYAALIGAFYSTLSLVLWEFRINPAYDATNSFGTIVMALTLLSTGALLWQMRKQ